jgi:hypothetical protein
MITKSDKALAYLTLISGLTISAVAVWYSVAGLVSIFAAAAIPIIIMGVALEVSKLVATVWLKINWHRAPTLIRTYLIAAITILMLITSMGIFGFLSKAHLDQNVMSGDVVDKVAIIDEKIKTQRDNIDAARKALVQMDSQVDQLLGRSADEKGAERAVQVRRNQAKERTRLQTEISTAQAEIAKLNEERAPMAKDLRAIEAEVGPIKYIAAFVYGDNPDANILEKAVTWVIIIIVVVFDPLAVVLLLASQYSFQWLRRPEEDEPKYELDDGPLTDEQVDQIKQTADVNEADTTIEDTLIEAEQRHNDYVPFVPMGTQYLSVQESEIEPTIEPELEDHEILDQASMSEAAAMTAWKRDHPESSLKLQRRLLERGIIDHLPWEDYLKPKADFLDDDAAEEAAKWALEQVEKKKEQLSEDDSKKKDSNLDGTREQSAGQEEQRTLESYVQNSEQNSNTLWQRIKDSKQ